MIQRTAWGPGKKRGEENLTNDTPPKKGFWTPPRTGRFPPPPQVSILCFSCTKIHDRAEQKLFWRGPKIFGRARSLVRFPPPIRFAPPPYHGPNDYRQTSIIWVAPSSPPQYGLPNTRWCHQCHLHHHSMTRLIMLPQLCRASKRRIAPSTIPICGLSFSGDWLASNSPQTEEHQL